MLAWTFKNQYGMELSYFEGQLIDIKTLVWKRGFLRICVQSCTSNRQLSPLLGVESAGGWVRLRLVAAFYGYIPFC